MKIAFIVDQFPAVSQTFVLRQMTGLIERGHEVTVFADYPGADHGYHHDMDRYGLWEKTHYFRVSPHPFQRFWDSIRLFAEKTTQRNGGSAGGGWWHFLEDVMDRGRFLKTLNPFVFGREALSLRALHWYAAFDRRRFDIIQAHFGGSGVIGAILKEMGVFGKLVTTFHGYGVRIAEKEGTGRFQRLFRTGDWFLANSQYTYHRLLALGLDPTKTSVLHPGVDLSVVQNLGERNKSIQKREESLKNGPIQIVSVARLVKLKGLKLGLEVFRNICSSMPSTDLEYHIVGSGPQKEELHRLAMTFGLTDRVHFHGALPFEDVVKVLKNAWVYLMPSLQESFGLSSLEAQALGVPVVAFDIGGVRETLVPGETGFLVAPRDVIRMAEKVKFFIDQPQKRFKMGEKGRLRVEEKFDQEKLNTHLVEVYESLLD